MVASLNRGPTDLLVWLAHVSVPFDWRWSKNRMWISRGRGASKALAAHARQRKDALATMLRLELGSRRIAHNRLWVSIHSELPNHRGDSINCIDLACDAIQQATGLDDRWYQIGGVTWEIVKHRQPRLHIWIGQESIEDVISCSSCGQLLPLDLFHAARNKLGHGSTCKKCASEKGKLRRTQNRLVMGDARHFSK